MNGLCFCAYSLTVTGPVGVSITGQYSTCDPTSGIVCMYARQLSPRASSWSTMLAPLKRCAVADALAICASVR